MVYSLGCRTFPGLQSVPDIPWSTGRVVHSLVYRPSCAFPGLLAESVVHSLVCILSCAVHSLVYRPSCAVHSLVYWPSCAVPSLVYRPSCAVSSLVYRLSCAVPSLVYRPSCAVSSLVYRLSCAVHSLVYRPSCAVHSLVYRPSCAREAGISEGHVSGETSEDDESRKATGDEGARTADDISANADSRPSVPRLSRQ